ncbi:hypothetical protein E2493_00275 [Sphingomonas parva]|uniref:AB hydrolase-1 domain-containing protein n=1 Tax=Sphingomonas parva TaxID=2555898 RepID=A0A4Y8ZXE3_9SPHN|nr:alpha/beta fold hydrolase [Sphingomonas parva]TFI60187.1 hypothetical protein E2493_00275 [Sphingomonas parva]
MWKLLLLPILVYAAILVLMFALQTRLVFPAGLAAQQGPVPPGTRALSLETPDGETLRGVHIAGAMGSSDPLLLVFPGNAWNAADAAALVHDILPDHDVVAFHYRGYAPSGGKASGAALKADALRVHEAVVRRFPGRPIIACGFSVGTGVAASLAGKRDLAGLVLVTPFDSLARVAGGHYRWLPVRWLFRHAINAAGALEGRAVPTAIVAAGGDTLIPAERTDALRRRVPKLVFDTTIEDAGHNDIYAHPRFRRAMAEAVAAVVPRAVKTPTPRP